MAAGKLGQSGGIGLWVDRAVLEALTAVPIVIGLHLRSGIELYAE